MNAKLSEERTVFKIVVPVRVERICIRPDLDVPPDFGFGRVHQPQPNGFPRRRPFACVRRKLPGTPSLPMPVSAGDPMERLATVSALGPLPECLPQNPFHPLERLPRHDVAVVIHPATNDPVSYTHLP